MDGTGFVPHRDETDLVFFQCGQKGIDLWAGQPEHESYVFLSEATRERLTSGDLRHVLLLYRSFSVYALCLSSLSGPLRENSRRAIKATQQQ